MVDYVAVTTFVSEVMVYLKEGLMFIATFMAKYIPFKTETIYLLLLILLCLFIAVKIINWIPSMKGHALYWLGLGAGLYFTFKYFGA